MSTSDATTTHEWLPMPSGISVSSHNSFSRELLRQFDKRRSQLYFDSISIQKDNVSIIKSQHSGSHHSQFVASSLHDTTSLSSSSLSIENANDLQLEVEEGEEQQDKVGERSDVVQYDLTASTHARRSKSAGNLLRKSSVYLRNKFNHNNMTLVQQDTPTLFHSLKKKKKSHRSAQDIFNNTNTNQPQQQQQQHLSKIAINTTINIGSINPNNHHFIDLSNSNHIIQPPIITQYPPKPLKYSPVEPLPDEHQYAGSHDHNLDINSNSKRRKTLHRLSLPLLKLTAATQPHHHEEREIHRRRSDSDLLNQQQHSISTTHHSLLHTIGKQWTKLVFTCKNRGASKKKKVAL